MVDTFTIRSLSSEDFKLTIVAVKSRSSGIITSSSSLERVAPAATRFERILSDWFELRTSSSLCVFEKKLNLANKTY